MGVAVQEAEQHDERDGDHGDHADRRHPDRGDAGCDADQRQRDLAEHEAEETTLGARCLRVGDPERRREVCEFEPSCVHLRFAHRMDPRVDAVGVL